MEEFIIDFLTELFGCEPECLYIEDGVEEQNLIYNEDFDSIFIPEYEEGTFRGEEYGIRFGCSKMTVIFDNIDVVFKIPYDGCYSDFEGAPEFVYFPNHIELEREIYTHSSKEMKKFLLDNEPFCHCGGVRVYTQKKIDKTQCQYQCANKGESVFQNLKEEERDKIFDLIDSRRNLPCRDFLAVIWNKVGEKVFKELVDEMDFEDMHNDNYGYMKNGMPVIFDYAGYCENSPF